MDSLDRVTALRIEKLRLSWEFGVRQLEMHERRYIQLLATALTVAVTALVSVLVEKVPPRPGLLLVAAAAGASLYANARLLAIPGQMRRIAAEVHRRYDNLIRLGGA